MPRRSRHPHAIVMLANHHQFAPRARFRASRVESRMLLWCSKGRGTVTINGTRHALAPGALFIIPWGHRISYLADASRPAHVGGVHVIPRLPPRSPIAYEIRHAADQKPRGYERRRDVPLQGLDRVVTGRQEEARALMHLAEYAVEWFVRGERDEATARTLGRMFLDEFVEYATRAVRRGGLPPGLRLMTEYVRDHLDRPASIDELAAVGECSPPTVWRLFRRHLGLTPVEWMQRLRVERAAELLATTTMRVGEIGRAVGVEDPYYFSRLFRKMRGVTPTQHRKRTALV